MVERVSKAVWKNGAMCDQLHCVSTNIVSFKEGILGCNTNEIITLAFCDFEDKDESGLTDFSKEVEDHLKSTKDSTAECIEHSGIPETEENAPAAANEFLSTTQRTILFFKHLDDLEIQDGVGAGGEAPQTWWWQMTTTMTSGDGDDNLDEAIDSANQEKVADCGGGEDHLAAKLMLKFRELMEGERKDGWVADIMSTITEAMKLMDMKTHEHGNSTCHMGI